MSEITDDEIRKLAYGLFRNGHSNDPATNWFKAKEMIQQQKQSQEQRSFLFESKLPLD